MTARTGLGFDTHRFAAGRRLVLGGVEVPHERGLAGHSDADVLAHAITDAVLGAAGLGDIGEHFPDTDPAFAGADSLELLRAAVALVRDAGWALEHVDATVVLERPKLAPHRAAIAERLSTVVGSVSVKATTGERMGFVGREEGVAALAVATLTRGGVARPRALHVTNGDATVPQLARSGLAGRILPWRDTLHEGPVPDVPDAELRRARAAFHGVAVAEFEARDRALDEHDGPFVLWFEADLCDQLQIAQVLARLARRDAVDVTLIEIGEHIGLPGFVGLGQLDAAQLRGIAGHAATTLSRRALALGARAWDALRGSDPRGIAEMATVRSGELRFLGEAFARLAREFPSTRDGLSLTERRLLAAAPGTAGEAFGRAARLETRPFLGDTLAFRVLERLARAATPLVAAEPPIARDTPLSLTGAGAAVLAGEADHVALNGVDRWVGGVHLHGRAVPWRWDEARERLVFTDRAGVSSRGLGE